MENMCTNLFNEKVCKELAEACFYKNEASYTFHITYEINYYRFLTTNLPCQKPRIYNAKAQQNNI